MFTTPHFVFKVDVDTQRATQIGVPNLVKIFQKHNIAATFFFSLGPDNTGKRIHRIFRPGFFKKTSLVHAIRLYGFKGLLYGTVLHPPIIGQSNEVLLKKVQLAGFEVGLHAYDHFEWQDYLQDMSYAEVLEEYQKGESLFKQIFEKPLTSIAAPGWQTNSYSLQLYDQNHLLYSSDTRGKTPFFPSIHSQSFRTLQMPTTFPTLDELLSAHALTNSQINDYYLDKLSSNSINIHTIDAKLEGISKTHILEDLILKLKAKNVTFISLEDAAKKYLKDRSQIPFCQVAFSTVEGNADLLACQGPTC